jgi:O-6-methylguanine DNA methyltransferase
LTKLFPQDFIMANKKRVLHPLPISTGDGEFTAWYSMTGLAGLTFPGQMMDCLSNPEVQAPPRARIWHCTTRKALAQALAGKPIKSLPPLDLSAATEFQRCVWKVLEQIRPGETMSYAQVAGAIGKPGAIRAVGQACGANPVPVLVPCHRILASNSRIGGFSGGGDWKIRLLGREGIRV